MVTVPSVSVPAKILIADDQPHVGEALRLALRDEGFQIELAGSPAAVVTAVQARTFDLALLDLNYARDTTSGREGIELIEQLRVLDCDLAIVVMTAWQRGNCRSGFAARRGRLHPEAVGQRGATAHSAYANFVGTRATHGTHSLAAG